MLSEAVRLTLTNLKTNRVRVLLTLSGISIGVILAVTSSLLLVSFKQKMMNEMKVAGETVINVAVGNKSNTLNYSPRPIFESKHVSLVKTLSHVTSAHGIIYFKTLDKMIEAAKSDSGSSRRLFQDTVFGTDPGYVKSIGVKFKSGRVFTKASEVVIGSEVASSGRVSVGDFLFLSINGERKKFTISGVIQKQKVVAFSEFGQGVNNLIAVPKSELPSMNFSLISVNVDSRINTGKVAQQISKLLNQDESIQNLLSHSTFKVTGVSQKDVINMVEEWFRYIRLLSIALSILASVIAMIGVINVMLMTLLERFKEIGIMKAVGASDTQLLSLYMVEIGLIGLTGAILGLFVGLSLAYFVSKMVGFPFIFQINIVFIALALGFGASLIAGLIPALKAARLDPNTALMYE